LRLNRELDRKAKAEELRDMYEASVSSEAVRMRGKKTTTVWCPRMYPGISNWKCNTRDIQKKHIWRTMRN